jgi:hypothetical protein
MDPAWPSDCSRQKRIRPLLGRLFGPSEGEGSLTCARLLRRFLSSSRRSSLAEQASPIGLVSGAPIKSLI